MSHELTHGVDTGGLTPAQAEEAAHEALAALARAEDTRLRVAVAMQKRARDEAPRPRARLGPGVSFEEVESPASARPYGGDVPGVLIREGGGRGAVKVVSPEQAELAYDVAHDNAVAAVRLAKALGVPISMPS